MTARQVILSSSARRDLLSIYVYVARRAGPETALGYVERIERFCLRLDMFPERGSRLPSGARLIAFEDSATVRMRVYSRVVRIIQIAYRGRDLSKEHS